MKRKHKKAQSGIYPLFVALFTIFALTFALIKLHDSKDITDMQGEKIFIGDKQSAVFASLQDADSIQLFLESAAELSSQQAISTIRNSCFVGFDSESEIDEYISPCGKYIYPQWSTNNTLCFPDCETALINAFKDDFIARTEDYFKLTGVELPISYNLSVDYFDDHFILRGLSDSSAEFNVLSMESRIDNPASRMLRYSGGKLAWPVETSSRNVHSCYGLRTLNGKADDHPGIDITASAGTRVIASASGRVVAADNCWGRVVVYHGSGLSTEYVHMGSISVKVDQEVAAGDTLGTVGGRGNVGGGCRSDAYPPHLHFAVLYKKVDPKLSYKGQRLAIHSFGTSDHIQPECLLRDAYSKAGSGCNLPVNTELDEVCELYALPEELFSPAEPGDRGVVASRSEALTGRVPADLTGTSSLLQDEKVISASFGTYAFKPSFTARVNKNLNDSLKPLTDWFESTWTGCNDEPQKCLSEKMAEFNKQVGNNYTIAFASSPKCEEYPLFSDFMEFFEDCFANSAYSCSCKFNFSKAYSRKDMSITFDTSLNTASLLVKESDGYKRVRDYEFFYGTIKPIDDSHKKYSYMLDFDEKTGRLSESRLIVYEMSDGSLPPIGGSGIFNDYPVVKIEKTAKYQGTFFDDETDTNKLTCQVKKDKFRLCAYPSDSSRKDLITVRFAFQLKDQPPKLPEEGEFKLVEAEVGPKDDTNNILSAVSSFVPGPLGIALNLLTSGALDDITSSKPSTNQGIYTLPKDENGNVIAPAALEVHCINSDIGGIFPEDARNVENAIVAVLPGGTGTSLASRYVDSNPYAKALETCVAPMTLEMTGETVSGRAVKATVQGDNVIVNLPDCGGLPNSLDKFNSYIRCYSVIPVDANGNKMSGDAISTCLESNSILDTVVDDLLKQGFASIIPLDLIPENIKPYINLPTSSDIADMLSGERSFNFVSMVNIDKLGSDLQGEVASGILSSINNDMLSNALTKSVDDLGSWEKQVVMSTLSDELGRTEAVTLFDKMLSGSGDAYLKQKAMAEGTGYIDSSESSELLKKIARGEDISSFAYSHLIEAADELSSGEKEDDLLEVAKSPQGQELSQRIIAAASEKEGCLGPDDASVERALSCLRRSEIDDFYQGYLTDYNAMSSGQQALIERAVDRMDASDVLKQLALNSDPNGIASELLGEALKEMPDWAKDDMVTDLMDGRLPDAEMLQREAFKNIDSELTNNLMKDPNVNALLRGNMEQYLQSQFNSFLQGGCTPSQS